LERAVGDFYIDGYRYEDIAFEIMQNDQLFKHSIHQLGDLNLNQIEYKALREGLYFYEFKKIEENVFSELTIEQRHALKVSYDFIKKYNISEEDYDQFISLLEKRNKTVDNAVQRIKKKGREYMEMFD
jgi:hypothetical protein